MINSLLVKTTYFSRLFYATSTTTSTTTTTTPAPAAHAHNHDHHHHDLQLPWRVDFTDMMEKDKDPTKVNPKRSAGPQGRSANVETNVEARSKVVFRDPADFSGEGTFKFPGDASESRPRPQRNIPANIPRVQINVGSKSRRKDSTTTTPAPNYQVIPEEEVERIRLTKLIHLCCNRSWWV